jgi:muconolactone D-isomerase
MEFLVQIEVRLPAEIDPQRKQALLEAEFARGKELIQSGAIRRIWRLPGRFANFTLYEVPDATVLHSLISSLPLWPYMDVTVHPLAQHPLEKER